MKKTFSIDIPSQSFQLMPHMIPHIRISPFLPIEWFRLLQKKNKKKNKISLSNPSFWLNQAKDIKLFDSGRTALLACLHYGNLAPQDEVLILTTTNGPYISSCVTKTIETVCAWKRELSSRTRLVLVIHEFGFPCSREIIETYRKRNITIVEDCAYAIGSKIQNASIGQVGDYAIYSLTKYYPVPFGGFLVSKKKLRKLPSIPELNIFDQKLLHQTIQNSNRFYPHWNTLRKNNWHFYAKQLQEYNIFPYFPLNKNLVPGVFWAKLSSKSKGDLRKKKLTNSGVEATEYYGQEGFYFPVHQYLTEFEKNYILYNFIHFS